MRTIQNRKTEPHIRRALRNYLVVRTVSIFESFMLNTAVRYIDNNPQLASQLIADLNLGSNPGLKVASAFSFMSISDIGSVYDVLSGKDFLAEIRKQSEDYATDYTYESEHIRYASPLHKKWHKFEQIFDLRNSIIHHGKLLPCMAWKEYRDMIESVIDFLLCTPLVIPVV